MPFEMFDQGVWSNVPFNFIWFSLAYSPNWNNYNKYLIIIILDELKSFNWYVGFKHVEHWSSLIEEIYF